MNKNILFLSLFKTIVDCMVIGRLIMNFVSVGILQTIWTKMKGAVSDQIAPF